MYVVLGKVVAGLGLVATGAVAANKVHGAYYEMRERQARPDRERLRDAALTAAAVVALVTAVVKLVKDARELVDKLAAANRGRAGGAAS